VNDSSLTATISFSDNLIQIDKNLIALLFVYDEVFSEKDFLVPTAL